MAKITPLTKGQKIKQTLKEFADTTGIAEQAKKWTPRKDGLLRRTSKKEIQKLKDMDEAKNLIVKERAKNGGSKKVKKIYKNTSKKPLRNHSNTRSNTRSKKKQSKKVRK